MSRVVNELMRYVDHMGVQQWMLVLIVAIGLGMLCLRGFGSRSNY